MHRRQQVGALPPDEDGEYRERERREAEAARDEGGLIDVGVLSRRAASAYRRKGRAKEKNRYLASAAHANSARAGEVTAENIRVAFVHGRADVVEFCDECVFEPVDEHF